MPAAKDKETPRQHAEAADTPERPVVTPSDLPKDADVPEGMPDTVEKPLDQTQVAPDGGTFPQPRVHAPEGSVAAMGPAVERHLDTADRMERLDEADIPVETVASERWPAPGQTERGWSPEVTARHPDMIAANVEAIMEERGMITSRGRRRVHGPVPQGVDPMDREALEAALRQHGFTEVVKQDLINEAIKRGSDQLAALDGAAAANTIHATMAAHEVLDDLKTHRERFVATDQH